MAEAKELECPWDYELLGIFDIGLSYHLYNNRRVLRSSLLILHFSNFVEVQI